MDVAELIALPEGKTLDFKRDLSSLRPVMKNLVAFANTAGGTLVIGVTDDRQLVGLADVLQQEERLASAIADSIAPQLVPEIDIITYHGKNLLAVRVPFWRGPFYLKTEGPDRGVYMRLGSESRRAGPELIAELTRHLRNLSYDQQPCAGRPLRTSIAPESTPPLRASNAA